MKKRIFQILAGMLIAILIWMAYDRISAIEDKIVVVDSQKVLEEYNGFKEAKDVYELKIKELSETFNEQRMVFESKSKELELLGSSLSKNEKAQRQADLARLKEVLLKSGASIENRSLEEEDKLLKGVYNKVNDFIERFGERKGYKVILGANGQGNVLFVKDRIDITQEVIKELNREYVEGI